MFKTVHNKNWIFDAEWIPDPITGRVLYKLPDDLTDEEVMQEMWKKGGATEDDPTPYLKTVLGRVVSISAVTRTVSRGEVTLRLLSLPRSMTDSTQISEKYILETFLTAIGSHKPQLIGYNSRSSDLRIMVQRGIVSGIQADEFCRRPEKPWEGVDYFARGSDFNIDLMEIVGGWGKSSPSLNEMATACGIPGKIFVDGDQVAQLWLKGELDKIVAYNEFDAITTYLLWLRIAHFGGFLSVEKYQEEQNKMSDLLTEESQKAERRHLKEYLIEWERLRIAFSDSKPKEFSSL